MAEPNITITLNPNPMQYRTTRKSTLAVGVEEATRIEPPGPDWELISVAIAGGTEVFFFWKRPTFNITQYASNTEL